MERKPINQLLSSEMDRREFLGLMGAAALTVVGASSIIKGLANIGQQQKRGYGTSTYGTSRKKMGL